MRKRRYRMGSAHRAFDVRPARSSGAAPDMNPALRPKAAPEFGLSAQCACESHPPQVEIALKIRQTQNRRGQIPCIIPSEGRARPGKASRLRRLAAGSVNQPIRLSPKCSTARPSAWAAPSPWSRLYGC